VILDDADSPAVEGGLYVIAYGELVDGYRHAYATTTRPDGRGRKVIRYSRTFGHPTDPRCPECAARIEQYARTTPPTTGRADGQEGGW
jgi:hypothetical protein